MNEMMSKMLIDKAGLRAALGKSERTKDDQKRMEREVRAK